MRVVSMLILVALVAGGVTWFAWDRGILFDNPRAPTHANFERVIRNELERAGAYQESVCAQFEHWANPPDQQGLEDLAQFPAPGQFVLTMANVAATGERRRKQLEQLEALANAGFFAKSRAAIRTGDGRDVEATRFTLTWNGWIQSDQSKGLCFRWGRKQLMSIEGAERAESDRAAADPIYRVTYRYGVRNPETWMGAAATQAVFDAGKELTGEVKEIWLVRSRRGWITEARAAAGDDIDQEPPKLAVDKALIDKLVKALAAYDRDYLPQLCLALPPLYAEDGGVGYLAVNRGGNYRTVLWQESSGRWNARPSERVTLERLERAGVMTSEPVDATRYRGPNQIRAGKRYILKKEHERHLAKIARRVSCLMLAERAVEVVDFDPPVKYEGQPFRVNFRVRVTPRSIAEWVETTDVQSRSTVARIMLTDGIAALGALQESGGAWQLRSEWAALAPGLDDAKLAE